MLVVGYTYYYNIENISKTLEENRKKLNYQIRKKFTTPIFILNSNKMVISKDYKKHIFLYRKKNPILKLYRELVEIILGKMHRDNIALTSYFMFCQLFVFTLCMT